MDKEGRNGLLKHPLHTNYKTDVFLSTFFARKKSQINIQEDVESYTVLPFELKKKKRIYTNIQVFLTPQIYLKHSQFHRTLF